MVDEFKLQFLTTLSTLMTAAFGMVAALAWNTAISAMIKEFLGETGSGIWAMVIYALVVTVIAVLATVVISRSANKMKEKVEADKKTEEA